MCSEPQFIVTTTAYSLDTATNFMLYI